MLKTPPGPMSLGALVFFLLFIPHFATAQTQTNSNANQANEVLREKAFDLLESVASQIGTLQSPENRARLGSNIAASLWNHDEQRARSLLVSVQDDINLGLQNPAIGEAADPQRRLVFLQLRINTVERIAKYDGDLALAFFTATQPPNLPQQDKADRAAEAEREFELRLAKQVAASSPKIALSLARQSLSRGFSFEVITLLRQLNRNHKEEADLLYGEIMAKLKRVNLTTTPDALHFMANLARLFAPPDADEASFRELVNLLLSYAATLKCSDKATDQYDYREYACRELGSLLPLIEKIDPQRAANLKQWRSDIYNGFDYAAYEEINEVEANATVDDLLALKSKFPRMEDSIYWRAMQKAAASGDLQRAQEIATAYQGNPQIRQSMLEQIERQQQLIAQLNERLKSIQATLSTMPNVEQRVRFLLFASNAIAPTDRNTAGKLLDQASEMSDTMAAGRDQMGAQIAMALMYCSQKNVRGLAIMESLVPKINELIGAAAKLQGYENNYLRDGEWNMGRQGILGSMLTELAENAALFAWCDFDRAVRAASGFERSEIRIMAQLKIAQGILAGPPKPFIWRDTWQMTY